MSLAGFLLACLCGTSLGDFLSMPFAGAAKKCNWKRNNAHHKTFKWVGGSSTNPPPSHHSSIRSAGHQSNSSFFSSLSPHPGGYANSNYLPLRVDWVTYLNWFSRWEVGESVKGEEGSIPSHHHHQCFSGFGSVISLPHTAFTDEPKCISLLTVVANLRWVFHSKQIAPARIKCAHTNCRRTCQKTQLWI